MKYVNRSFLFAAFLSLGMACGDDNTKTPSNNTTNNNNINNTNQNNTTGSNNQNNTNNPDPSLACNPPAELEDVEHELWSNTECSERSPDLGERVYTTTEELLENIDCGEADPGVDFSIHRLAFVVANSNPNIGLRGVVEDENGAIKIYTASPAYCGGAAPPNSGLFVLVPADERDVIHSPCVYGQCDFENNMAPPGSP